MVTCKFSRPVDRNRELRGTKSRKKATKKKKLERARKQKTTEERDDNASAFAAKLATNDEEGTRGMQTLQSKISKDISSHGKPQHRAIDRKAKSCRV